jgi:Polyketide cyclase / dehydrase and lipid transport
VNAPARVGARINVKASPETVFAAATDWDRQREWMLGTTVRVCHGDGRSVGSEVEAVTGIAGIGVRDRMQITVWDAPSRCEMRHLGRVVRGVGIFAVRRHGAEDATFEWSEQLELPFGVLGALGWPLVRPFFGVGLRRSLERFAAFCQTYPQ